MNKVLSGVLLAQPMKTAEDLVTRRLAVSGWRWVLLVTGVYFGFRHESITIFSRGHHVCFFPKPITILMAGLIWKSLLFSADRLFEIGLLAVPSCGECIEHWIYPFIITYLFYAWLYAEFRAMLGQSRTQSTGAAAAGAHGICLYILASFDGVRWKWVSLSISF